MLGAILILFLTTESPVVFAGLKIEDPISVKIGDDAKFVCDIASTTGIKTSYYSVKWLFRDYNETGERLLYQRLITNSTEGAKISLHHITRVQIDENDTLKHTIEIPHMELSDSGTYKCVVTPPLGSDQEEEKQQQQKVFVYTKGSGPVLNITKEAGADGSPDLVHINCNADGVAPTPDLVIFVDSKEMKAKSDIEGGLATGTSNVHVNTTLKAGDVDGRTVRCELFYKNTDVKHEVFADSHQYYVDESARLRSTERSRLVSDTTTPQTVSTTPQNNSSNVVWCSWLFLLAVTAFMLMLQTNCVLY